MERERLEIGSVHFPVLRLLSLYRAKIRISADVYIWNVSIDANLHGFLIERRALIVLTLFAMTVLQLCNIFFDLCCEMLVRASFSIFEIAVGKRYAPRGYNNFFTLSIDAFVGFHSIHCKQAAMDRNRGFL